MRAPPASPSSPKLYPHSGIHSPPTLPITFVKILDQMPPLQGSLSQLPQQDTSLHSFRLSKASLLLGSACNGPLTGVKSVSTTYLLCDVTQLA